MPERINSLGSSCSGAILISLVIAMNSACPVQAESPCIEHPPQPVAEVKLPGAHYDFLPCSWCHAAATEVLLWSFRQDHAKGRKCWFLSDTHGRDVTEEHGRGARPPTRTIWSRITSVFDNFSFTGVSPNPASDTLPSSPVEQMRKRPANAANANKTDESVRLSTGVLPTNDALPSSPVDQMRRRPTNAANANKTNESVRLSQKNAGEGQATKQVSKVPEVVKGPDQAEEPEEPELYEEFLRWSTPDLSRSTQH